VVGVIQYLSYSTASTIHIKSDLGPAQVLGPGVEPIIRRVTSLHYVKKPYIHTLTTNAITCETRFIRVRLWLVAGGVAGPVTLTRVWNKGLLQTRGGKMRLR
jgi:hypothetical protein